MLQSSPGVGRMKELHLDGSMTTAGGRQRSVSVQAGRWGGMVVGIF